MTMKNQAYAAVRWTTAVTVGRVALQTLQLIVLARLISPQDFGLMAMILTVTAFIQLFADLGVSNSIIHAREIAREVLSTLYWLNVLIGAMLSGAIWAASPWISGFYSEPALAAPLAFAGLSFLLLALGQQIKVLAEKRLAFRPVAVVEMIAALASTVVTLVAAYNGFGVYSLVAGVLVLAGGNSLFYWLFVRDGWWPGLQLSFSDAKPHLKSGLYLLGTSLANTATVQADVILVGRLLGSTALGFYTVPRELCLKIMFATNPIVTRVGTPLIAQAQGDPGLLRRVYLSTIRMTSSVNFPIYGAIATFRHEVVEVVFGPAWSASADLLGLMAVWGMFRALGNPVGSLLYGTGRSRLALAQSLAVTILIIPTVLLGSLWGPAGVASALTLFYIGFTFGVWWFVVKPVTGAGVWAYSEQWATPLLVTLLACVISLASVYTLSSTFVRLAVGLPVGAIAYLGISWMINRKWCLAMWGLVGLRQA
ncbi:MAG: colanic acid exporter [Rhizobium sp.]|nr:colanic acid exporter [Rhizobium sp.]